MASRSARVGPAGARVRASTTRRACVGALAARRAAVARRPRGRSTLATRKTSPACIGAATRHDLARQHIGTRELESAASSGIAERRASRVADCGPSGRRPTSRRLARVDARSISRSLPSDAMAVARRATASCSRGRSCPRCIRLDLARTSRALAVRRTSLERLDLRRSSDAAMPALAHCTHRVSTPRAQRSRRCRATRRPPALAQVYGARGFALGRGRARGRRDRRSRAARTACRGTPRSTASSSRARARRSRHAGDSRRRFELDGDVAVRAVRTRCAASARGSRSPTSVHVDDGRADRAGRSRPRARRALAGRASARVRSSRRVADGPGSRDYARDACARRTWAMASMLTEQLRRVVTREQPRERLLERVDPERLGQVRIGLRPVPSGRDRSRCTARSADRGGGSAQRAITSAPLIRGIVRSTSTASIVLASSDREPGRAVGGGDRARSRGPRSSARRRRARDPRRRSRARCARAVAAPASALGRAVDAAGHSTWNARAAPGATTQPQPAAVRAHDAEHRGEAEAVAGRLGREERLEDAAAGLAVHAGTVVGDLEHDVGAGGAR